MEISSFFFAEKLFTRFITKNQGFGPFQKIAKNGAEILGSFFEKNRQNGIFLPNLVTLSVCTFFYSIN